ncbi:hypothetical protein QJS66_17595 [Kocuria rhizophila]|nr:hypothetical protein QJS66_17595 [Kocuria rhizophila]
MFALTFIMIITAGKRGAGTMDRDYAEALSETLAMTRGRFGDGGPGTDRPPDPRQRHGRAARRLRDHGCCPRRTRELAARALEVLAEE